MGGNTENPHQSSSSDDHRRRRIDFRVGSSVEVRTDEKGLRGVYFSATVIPPPPGTSSTGKRSKKLLYVEYHNLLATGEGSERLREYVDASSVRPPPPALLDEDENDRGFKPDDVVDAFYQDGWWIGVVSRVVDGGETVAVRFRNPPEELEFGVGDVRAHWDWANGVWVKQQSVGFMMSMFGVGRMVEILTDEGCYREAWIPARIDRDLSNGVFLVRYDIGEDVMVKVGSDKLRPCPPRLAVDDVKKFVLWEKVDAFFDFSWRSGVIMKELENDRYVVLFKQMKIEKEFDRRKLRPHMEWKSCKWLLSSFSDHNSSEKPVLDGETLSSLKSPNDLKMSSNKRRSKYKSDLGTTLKKHKEGNAVEDRHDKPIEQVVCGSVNNMEKAGKSELRRLPFVKTTSTTRLWETLESMQVFQRLQQKPHFQPLQHIKESFREGFAIANMVSFARLVEKACRLQLSDPKSIIADIMKTLGGLERHGFDVSIVQDRLTKLLAMKVKHENLVVEINNYKEEITEQNLEKTRIEEEIEEMKKQMKELQEKRTVAESGKEKEEREVASLQAELKVTQENIKIAKCDFETIVSEMKFVNDRV